MAKDKLYKVWFCALILSQILHSIEEIHFDLWQHFDLARSVSTMFNPDPNIGFIIANTLVIILAVFSAKAIIFFNHPKLKFVIYFWALLEILNGCVHIYNALVNKAYFPGVITAPLLILFSVLAITSYKHVNTQELS